MWMKGEEHFFFETLNSHENFKYTNSNVKLFFFNRMSCEIQYVCVDAKNDSNFPTLLFEYNFKHFMFFKERTNFCFFAPFFPYCHT